MSQTISDYDKITINNICRDVFGLTLEETALDGSFEKDTIFTIEGPQSTKVFLWQISDYPGNYSFLSQYVLFYCVESKSFTLDNELKKEKGLSDILKPITNSGALKLWFCYSTIPFISIPKAVLQLIPNDFPRTEELYLEEGASVLYGISKTNLGKTFPWLNKVLPTTDTSLLLYFGQGHLSWNFNANFGTNGWTPLVGPNSKINELFAFKEASLTMLWQKGLPITWMLGAELEIAKYKLETSYLHPQQIVTASLSPTNTAENSIQSFLETTIGVPKGASKLIAEVLTAVDLSIHADIPNKEIQFKVQNAKEWDLIPNILKVSNMDFRIYLAAQQFAIAELYLDLVLPIGKGGTDVTIDLEGAYDKTDIAPLWHFQAEVEDKIAMGELITGLVGKFGATAVSVPDDIKNLYFSDLFLSFDHMGDQTAFHFSGNIIYEGEEEDVFIHVEIKVAKSGPKWKVEFETFIQYGDYKFAVNFEKSEGTAILASLQLTDKAFHLASFLEAVLPNEFDLIIPDDLNIGIKNAYVAFYFPEKKEVVVGAPAGKKEQKKSSKVFGLEIDLKGSIDFTEIPGIGPLMDKAEISLESMRIVGSASDLDQEAVNLIDGILSKQNLSTLGATQPKSPKADKIAFPKGVLLSAMLKLPDRDVRLAHSFSKKKDKLHKGGDRKPDQERAVAGSTNTPAKTSGKGRAVNTGRAKSEQRIGTQLGPFLLESVGLSMQGSKFGLRFTGGIILGPMEVQLINFSVRSSLNEFSPEFDLDGIGIGYDQPPLSIAGLFLKVEEEKTEGNKLTKTLGFRGGISIGFKAVTVTALGAYNHVKVYQPVDNFSHSFHSFFVYGYLGAPLGGPPFFFITGLALGVGFNMGLNIPPPEEFETFPLTAAALKPSGTALTVDDLKDMMLSLDRYIPIQEGSFWFAVGIKFETFKFLSGFLMLTVELGDELEIGILGIVDALMPLGTKKPIVRLSIGFAVRILPERGVVEARGSFLPTTFILHEDVKIEGGMALLTIMKDQEDGQWKGAKAGEFVFTLGGYGPMYKPKKYHPIVPALELEWKVDDNLFITAGAYFALTPEAIMLGAHLHGHFDYSKSIVSVAIDFKLALDFILYFKPTKYRGKASAKFHLKGEIEVDLGLYTVDKSLEMDASAALTIWGPDFAGKANLKLHFFVSFSVNVSFGESYRPPKPLNWKEFKESLLPKLHKAVTLTISKGHVQESRTRVYPTINPYDLTLYVESQIPIKKILDEEQEVQDFGIKPMGVTKEDFESEVFYRVYYDYRNLVVTDQFEVTTKTLKNIPSALWQPASKDLEIPKSNGKELIEGVTCGFEIRPKFKEPTVVEDVKLQPKHINDILKGYVGEVHNNKDVKFSDQADPNSELISAFYEV